MLVANKLFTIYFVSIISVGAVQQMTITVGVSPFCLDRKTKKMFISGGHFLWKSFNGLGYNSRNF